MFTRKALVSCTFASTTLAITLFAQSLLAQTTLITNVNGYTLNYADSSELPSQRDIQHVDGAGKTLLPGLIDAHGHVLSYGLSLLRVDLTGTATEQEAVQRKVSINILVILRYG